jgi:hypothetical protein
MSTQAEQERPGGTGDPGPDPDRDERAAYEAEMSRITSADMVFQAAVSLLNIGAYRMGLVGAGGSEADRSTADREGGPGSARDLEQVRDAIDGVRGLLPVLERSSPQELRPLRDALSQLQLAYTRAAQPASPVPPAGDRPAVKPDDRPEGDRPRPGPAESTGRLWVPGR